MALNRKAVLVGLLVCAAGLWLIIRPGPTGVGSTLISSSAEWSGDNPTTTPNPAPLDQSGGAGSSSADVDGSDAPPTAFGAELGALTPETVPPTTTTTTAAADPTTCDRAYAGLGVEMRSWGDVLLPYTPGYPTSDPGEVWDCTAYTAFGGAVAMTHAAYLEALRPDAIPAIALDTPGRAARLRDHAGPNRSASLGFQCSPIGWNWDGDHTWSLLHQCGEGELRVSFYPMEYRNGRWWLVYPRDGEIETGTPPEGYEYYAFIGGD